ncbi:MAG: ABC transporter ATP-binding protein [Oscillospiraceae bacterium]|nr:ABC transporter ATP-binding protein [Oscillospiraceae bacterium]
MIRQLAGSIREYKRQSVYAPLLMLIECGMEVLIPFIMSKLVDNGVQSGDMRTILLLGVLLLLAAAVSMAGGVGSARMAATASAGFAKNLRHDVFYNVQNYSFSNIDKFSTSSIVTRLTTDITMLQNAYMMLIRMAFRAPLMLIFSFAMVFHYNWKLALIFMCAIPLLALGLFLIASHVFPLFKKVFNNYDDLNGVVQENLRGIRVVKSFVRDEHENDKFGVASGNLFKNFVSVEKLMSFNMPLMQFAIYASLILVSWIGAKLIVIDHSLTTGELMSVYTYSTMILMSLMMLSMVFVQITMGRNAAQRVSEVLTEKSDITSPPLAITEVKDGSITFEDVSFSYSGDPNKLCLTDVELKIDSGDVVGIIGGTGSGKSTLVQLIPRIYDATTGTVRVGGVDVRSYDLKTLRDSVAMVLQKNELFSGTIKENLRWGDENATDEELERVCRLACADEFIQEMPDKYDTYIEQGGSNVSGGQKQRLCIARALLKKPAILILDDSTSAVDTATDAKIRQAFRDEIPHTTKLIIAQRISSVQDADKIIVLDGGRINAVGTHEELLKSNKIYQEVYASQQKGGEDDV